jgi:hypothetical protein
MVILDTVVLYHPGDDDLSPKRVREFIRIEDLLFYINFVHSFLNVVDYSHNARHKYS